jgi:hypothetical protein
MQGQIEICSPNTGNDEIAKALTAILFRSREDGLFRV